MVSADGIKNFNCPGDLITFQIEDSSQYSNIQWNVITYENGAIIGNVLIPGSATFILNELSTQLTFVKVIAFNGSSTSNSTTFTIQSRPAPPEFEFEFDLPNAIYSENNNLKTLSICKGDSIEISYPNSVTPDHSFNWSNGDITPNTYLDSGGTYVLSTIIGTGNCPTFDSVNIIYLELDITFELDSQIICDGDSLTISPNSNIEFNINYEWNNGAFSGSEITVVDPGSYEVIGSIPTTQSNFCYDTAQTSVSTTPLPESYVFDTLRYSETPYSFDSLNFYFDDSYNVD